MSCQRCRKEYVATCLTLLFDDPREWLCVESSLLRSAIPMYNDTRFSYGFLCLPMSSHLIDMFSSCFYLLSFILFYSFRTIYCCNASRKDLINVHLFTVPIAYSHPQSVRILALHATVLVLLAAISISVAPSPRHLVAVVCMVPVSVVPILIIMRSSPPVPVVVGACRRLLAPAIHPASHWVSFT
jgi:hypothetical protein